MLGFLNEHSLEIYGDWSRSLTFFLIAANKLSPHTTLLLKDSAYFSQGQFKQRFNAISLPKDQRALISEVVFGNRYYSCWRPTRVSLDTEQYSCALPPLQTQDTSICEAAERRLTAQGEKVFLLSAPNSAFAQQNTVNVLKTSSQQAAPLPNAAALEVIVRWLASERGNYDRSSASTPRDFQTVLQKNQARFRPTNMIERRFSRRVFEEIATGRLFYVDDAHPGASAHLEVFSSNREHLGTADIDTGNVNEAGRVAGRTLRY